MKKKLIFGLFLFILSACGSKPPLEGSVTPIPDATPATSVMIIDVDRLNLCMVGEPNSIYMYDPINISAQKALSIIYDGIVAGQPKLFKESILDRLPSFENGAASVVPIEVKQGDVVVVFNGSVKPVAPGDRVLPSGCREMACSVEFDGQPLLMDQVMVNFSLLPGLRWSDGEALTADDSIFSYMLAKNATAPDIHDLVERTASYEKVSDDVLQWWGIPGYLSVEPSAVFYPPFPKHLHPTENSTDLEKNAMSDALLAGWGAYKFERWVNGEMIFSPNPYFFDPNGKTAQFKELVIKYFPSSDDAYQGFMNGECDVVDRTSGFEKFTPIFSDLSAKGEINLQVTKSPLIETLVYNTREQTVQHEFNPLSDPLIRAGISNCIDRYALVNYDLHGYPVITDSLVAPYDLAVNNDWTVFTRSMSEAKEYLERAGWNDDDNNPVTPRVAKNIPNVKDGTKLNLVYAVANTPFRVSMANTISKMLVDCGVAVQTKIVEPDQYFAASSAGTLASGNFDIAEFAFGSYDITPPCEVFNALYTPVLENGWQGVNYSGYSNADYSIACMNASASSVDKTEWAGWLKSTHEILLNGGPALPLFHQYEITVAQPDVCLPAIDPTDPLGYVSVVKFSRGAECRPTP